MLFFQANQDVVLSWQRGCQLSGALRGKEEHDQRPEEILGGLEIPGVPLGRDKGHGATQEITDV